MAMCAISLSTVQLHMIRYMSNIMQTNWWYNTFQNSVSAIYNVMSIGSNYLVMLTYKIFYLPLKVNMLKNTTKINKI